MEEIIEKTIYKPVAAVWEITMDCNMRCKHCGSSCSGPLPDELTTEEALEVCDSLGRLGLQRITLSGGEPFTRDDWHLIVARLSKNQVITNILSNGWFIDREIAKKAGDAGAVNIGISLDGVEETHDYIRKKGSYARIMNALDVLREQDMSTAIATSIHKKNIHELPEIKEVLIEKGVKNWQLQAAMPMGNLLNHMDWIPGPEDVDRIIDFAYDAMKEGRIRVHLSDDVGYFNLKEIEVRKSTQRSELFTGIWDGCPAGTRALGIRCNGDILGCLSIRDDSYIEGNVREIPLEKIWNNPDGFAWFRSLSKNKLSGFCKICQYGNYCLGGCSSNKLTRYDTMTENQFCAYWAAAHQEKQKAAQITDVDLLTSKGRELAQNEDYQSAEIYLSRALEMKPGDTELLNLLGYAHYFLENYPECETCNRRALETDTDNAYSLKGLGLALSKQGRVDEGIKLLKKAVEHCNENFMDPYHDLAVTLMENNRPAEALTVLEEGRNRSPAFKNRSEKFYRQLKENTKQ
jgi:radical SAM protein with 4Fe4S-binding SPASM domain